MAKRNVVDFKIINLSEEKFQELKDAGQIDPNALYTTPDTTKERLDALEATVVNYDNITNCITEIPQDIKLELNNGTLTLKAGSKVYMPNGFETDGVTKKFDVINIVSDVVLTQRWGSSQTFCLAVNKDGSGMAIYDIARTYSGTFTSYSSGFYYEEDKNLLNIYDNGVLNRQISFPIAIITGQSPTIDSIDQIFNGLGYIGSTVFVLPGVKGMIPNGRNEDGTLKNITLNNASIKTVSAAFAYPANIEIAADGTVYASGSLYYDPKQNICLNSRGEQTLRLNAGTVIFGTNGKVTSFEPKTAFHAVDYSDTEFIAHQAMPSDRYVDLTLPASGGNITAPADGWIYLGKQSSAANQYIKLGNGKKGKTAIWSNAGSQDLQQTLPVNEGDTIQVNYTAGGAFQFFRFVYANGAK